MIDNPLGKDPHSSDEDRATLDLPVRPFSTTDEGIEEVTEIAARLIDTKNPDIIKVFEQSLLLARTNAGMVEGINKYELSQRVDHDGKKLGFSSPKIGTAKTADSGAKFLQSQSKGAVRHVPLLSSAMWIRMKKPSLDAVINFSELMLSSRATYGRDSVGSVLSALESDMISDIIDFCMDHVVGGTAKVSEMRGLILASDYQCIIMTMATLLHTTDYPYRQVCTNTITVDPVIPEGTEPTGEEEPIVEICGHVVKGNLSLPRTIVHTWSRLTPAQLDFMSDRNTIHTAKKIKEMQFGIEPTEDDEEGVPPMAGNRILSYDVFKQDGKILRVKLRNPTLKRYSNSSQKWVRRMTTMAERIGVETRTEAGREEYKRIQTNITMVQQQAHLIHSFELVDEDDEVEMVETNLEGIDSVIGTYSDFSKFVDNMMDAYEDATGEITMTWVGIPAEPCVKCGSKPKGYENQSFIPLPIGALFFILAAYKSQGMVTA